jgi:hypothetical protein
VTGKNNDKRKIIRKYSAPLERNQGPCPYLKGQATKHSKFLLTRLLRFEAAEVLN